jgi:hypothetical protein
MGNPKHRNLRELIQVPAGDNVLNSFTFYVQDNVKAISYQAYVYQWNNVIAEITGSPLYQSPILTTPINSGNAINGFYTQTINTGGIPITSGHEYALFFTTSSPTDPSGSVSQGPYTGQTAWGEVQTTVNNALGFVYQNNGNSFSDLSTQSWNSVVGYNAAFQADFSVSPAPGRFPTQACYRTSLSHFLV